MFDKTINIFQTEDYSAAIADAAERLRAGGVVVLPTETVYGLAAMIRGATAMRRLGALRSGDQDKPFTPHLSDPADAIQFLGPVGELGRRMMKKLWPGPVALIFDVPPARRQEVAVAMQVAESDLYHAGRITLRCPDHPVTSEVIRQTGSAVALAQPAGGGALPPMNLAQIEANILDQVDLALDAGPCKYSKPSTIVQVLDDRYEVVREGVFDARIIERLLRTTILFVCSGNTCRSPMAEAIARRVIADKLKVTPDELEKKGINVLSAGSFAMPGAKAAQPAIDVAKHLGADLSQHRSRPLTVELIHQADHIFTMSRNHLQAVTALVPSAADKAAALDPENDIEDPIGGDMSLYAQVAGQLEKLIESRMNQVLTSDLQS